MPEEGSIQHNMEKGKGVVRKDGFRVIGLSDEDRKHPEASGKKTSRSRGRPPSEKNWNTVGRSDQEEQASIKPKGD
jgi:hypothetical protein